MNEPARRSGPIEPSSGEDASPGPRFTVITRSGPSLIVSANEYRAGVPARIPWVIDGFAYAGGVTLLAGPPKAGKSTLLADLQRSRWTGSPFLGAWRATKGPVLLVTEESGIPVVLKLEGNPDVLDRKAAIEFGYAALDDILWVIGEWSHLYPDGVVVIDTFAVWAGLKDENDASATTAAIAEITGLAATTGISIILVHHTRRGGGQAGEAVRGSSAILATVDIAAELSYTEAGATSPRRWLEIRGRVMEAARYLIEYVKDPRSSRPRYRLVDPEEAAAERAADWTSVVPDAGATLGDLTDAWGVSDRTARRRIGELVNSGRLTGEVIDGHGTKRYRPADPGHAGHDQGHASTTRAGVGGAHAPLHPGQGGHNPMDDQRPAPVGMTAEELRNTPTEELSDEEPEQTWSEEDLDPEPWVMTYEELKALRRRRGMVLEEVRLVENPDVVMRMSWPYNDLQAQAEADEWAPELARLQFELASVKPPVDTPLDGPIIGAIEHAALIVGKLELVVPGIWDRVEAEFRRLMSPRRHRRR